MKKIKLSEIFTLANVKRVLALAIALMMILTFVGCKKDPVTSSNGGSSEPSKVESVNSNSSSEDSSTGSSNKTNSSKIPSTSSYIIDPLKGEISAEADVVGADIRTDEGEKLPELDPSNLSAKYVGYAEKERLALRDEILNTKNTLEYYKPSKNAKIYYVSPGGDNTNDGLSPETAIQTIDGIYTLKIEEGDFVLFERNSIYRINEDFELKTGVRYGSYGEGRKPMILGSAKNFVEETWQPAEKANVWEISYMYAYPCGVFINEGELYGSLRTSLRSLENNGDVYLDETTATMYLYCDLGNPSKKWKYIEISQNVGIFLPTGVNDIVVDNICMRYMGDGGVYGNYNNNNFSVTNCEVGFTGGVSNGQVRFGNGIGTWVGGERLYWDHNWVYQTWDSGMSPQGNLGRQLFDYHDISMSNNLFEFNNADIEIWESAEENPSKMYNYYMDNNIHRFTSLGWGTRPDDGGIRGIDGVFYGHTENVNPNQIGGHFSWNNNIVDCPGRKIFSFTSFTSADYNAWERKGNTFYIKQSIKSLNDLIYFGLDDINSKISFAPTNEADTISAIKDIEPGAKVFWYE